MPIRRRCDAGAFYTPTAAFSAADDDDFVEITFSALHFAAFARGDFLISRSRFMGRCMTAPLLR